MQYDIINRSPARGDDNIIEKISLNAKLLGTAGAWPGYKNKHGL